MLPSQFFLPPARQSGSSTPSLLPPSSPSTTSASVAMPSTDPSSPKQRSTKTPVPLLLSSFPTPPTHIPASPLPSPAHPNYSTDDGQYGPGNPPPSLPPASPLPPVPGPSPLSEHDALRLINVSRASRRTSKASVYSSSSRSSSDRLHDSDVRPDYVHSNPGSERASVVVLPSTPSPSAHTFGISSRPPSLADSVSSSARRSTSISSYSSSLSAHPPPSFTHNADRAKSPGLTAYLNRVIPEDDEGRADLSLTALSLNDIPRASPSPHPSWRDEDENTQLAHDDDTSGELELGADDSIASISMHDLPNDDEDEDDSRSPMLTSSNLNSSTSTCTYPRGGSSSSRSSLDLHFPLPPTATPLASTPPSQPPSAFPKRFAAETRRLSQTPPNLNFSLPSTSRGRYSGSSSGGGPGADDDGHDPLRSSSPGIEDMLNRTPRPRRRSTSSLGSRRSFSSRRSQSQAQGVRSRASASGPVRSASASAPKKGGTRRSNVTSCATARSSTMSGVEVRLNGSELPYLRSRESVGSKVGEDWNEDSFVEDYGTVIRGGDELTLDDLTGGSGGGASATAKWDPQADDLDASEAEDGDGNATDGSESSLDLHTPLPCVFTSLSIFRCYLGYAHTPAVTHEQKSDATRWLALTAFEDPSREPARVISFVTRVSTIR